MLKSCFFLATLLGLLAIATAQVPKGPCHRLEAQSETSSKTRTVNLDELWFGSSVNPFSASDPTTGWSYYFDVCANEVHCGSARVGACQLVSPTGFYELGSYYRPISATFLEHAGPYGAVSISTRGEESGRTATVTIFCDPNASSPTNISASSPTAPNLNYQFFLTHQSACGSPEPGVCQRLEAKGENGNRTVNLDELSAMSALAPFTTYDAGTGTKFSFGVCMNITCDKIDTPSAGCVTQPFPFSLGSYPAQITSATLITSGYVDGAVQIQVPTQGYLHMLLTVVCDYNAKMPSNIFAIAPKSGSQPPWYYQLFVTHRSACP